ncbi:2187_t:CDS:2, partial [Entrophospora sp. SA101]
MIYESLRKKDSSDQEMERFIDDESRSRLEFPPMNSYQRLIIHRVAQYFKLSHVVDASGKAVVLYKSPETQIPILRFSDLLEQDDEEKPEKSVKIMKRQQTYPLTQQQRALMNDPDSIYEGERKILSIEEREAAYLKARARIFKDVERQNNCILNDQQLEESNESSMVLNAGDSNRQFYNMSKQGRPMNNFPPGPPPSTIMQGHFGRPFFSGQPPPPHKEQDKEFREWGLIIKSSEEAEKILKIALKKGIDRIDLLISEYLKDFPPPQLNDSRGSTKSFNHCKDEILSKWNVFSRRSLVTSTKME